ncbi:MAG: F0F1 ATP synthase subunit epsilon [Azospirillaceae bacterium]|nr:F0F1 ATP synthase subunit epsilon [Azospirillaceae bacterium]
MTDKVEFELVSPEKLLFAQPVDLVVIPGGEGDFGVLPGHAPFIATVRPGVVAVYRDGAITDRLFVAGGFAEVNETGVTVLAENAMPVSEIDGAKVEEEIRALQEDLADAKDDKESAEVQVRLTVAQAKQEAVNSAAATSH